MGGREHGRGAGAQKEANTWSFAGLNTGIREEKEPKVLRLRSKSVAHRKIAKHRTLKLMNASNTKNENIQN